MLRTPAPFPHVGAIALVEREGSTEAVRILASEDDAGLVTVTGGPAGASGTSRVSRAQLLDPTPLTATEQAELDRLERTATKKADVARRDALRLRMIRAQTLEKIQREQRAAA